MESSKDTHPAPSQGDDSKSEPNSKRKDVLIDPSPNQEGEADPKENPDKNSQFEQENDQEDETDPKVPIRDNHAYPECSWSISSKGCQLQGVEPKDVCGVEGCQSRFHHMCQMEWEIYQYHLDYPNGDLQDCIYDSGEKK